MSVKFGVVGDDDVKKLSIIADSVTEELQNLIKSVGEVMADIDENLGPGSIHAVGCSLSMVMCALLKGDNYKHLNVSDYGSVLCSVMTTYILELFKPGNTEQADDMILEVAYNVRNMVMSAMDSIPVSKQTIN